ncbi:hypothetical protein COV93_04875 [Candidatus Woesearchaeota archaeon CG11_big_fil_rev_8_21_14_0_20_43_8]|nr:MAG: hypothetical protein COV93_04875 [Candidatus Woesearchaeota archaeon CG11_big_fil_rev_8_21_14_0_20_43_8]PIO07561.1 MAG: hypothetical protein COT47_01340 [Candidatus Woesearchaeota archaeon CG08_land_8_20_14_0_20_43_7]
MDKITSTAYFDVQSKIGVTKHVGGAGATDRLMELCDIGPDSYILEVGCGAGLATTYIAKRYGCRIMAIDIRKEMVEQAKATAKRRGVEDRIEFRVANAEHLPFKDNTFDAVITESVTAFTDKNKSIKEYKRVAKKGGYVGLNELTWVGETSEEIKDYFYRATGGVKPCDENGWTSHIKKAGLTDIIADSWKVKASRQFFMEMRLIGFGNLFRIMGRTIKYMFTDKKFRQEIKELTKITKDMPKGLMKTFGYGVYVGRK